MPHSQPARLDSEEVVLAAPMSVTGSAERLWKLARGHANAWMNAAVLLGLLRLITLVWANVTCWYAFFRPWLVPYRVNRRCSSGLQSARAFSRMPVTRNSVFPRAASGRPGLDPRNLREPITQARPIAGAVRNRRPAHRGRAQP